MRKRLLLPLFRERRQNCSSLRRAEAAGQEQKARFRETFRQRRAVRRGMAGQLKTDLWKKSREAAEQKKEGLWKAVRRKAVRQEEADLAKITRQGKIKQRKAARQEEAEQQKAARQEEAEQRKAARQKEAGQQKAEKQEETVPRKEAQLAEAGLQRTVKQEKTGLKQAARRQKAKAREEAVCRRRIRRHPAARNLLREGLSPRLRTKAGAGRRIPACPAAACRRQKAGRRLFS